MGVRIDSGAHGICGVLYGFLDLRDIYYNYLSRTSDTEGPAEERIRSIMPCIFCVTEDPISPRNSDLR